MLGGDVLVFDTCDEVEIFVEIVVDICVVAVVVDVVDGKVVVVVVVDVVVGNVVVVSIVVVVGPIINCYVSKMILKF